MNGRWISTLVVLVLIAVIMGALSLLASAAVTVVAWNFDTSNTTPALVQGQLVEDQN